jgi:hypothetical protein
MAPSGTLPKFEGFGNVVKSIEGLQQRLEDFSIVEVSQAHNSAQTLTTRLAELQAKLAEIASIKQAVEASRNAVDHAVLEWSSADWIDAADRPLRIAGAIPPSNVLIFPRVNRTAQSAVSAPADAIPTSRFEDVAEAVTPVVAEHGHEEPAEPHENDGRYFIPAAALEAEPSGNEPRFSEAIFTADPPELGTGAQQRESVKPQKARSTAGAADQDAGGPEFDQRLLDDLIQNYGEFVGSFGPGEPVEEPELVPSTAQVTPTMTPQTADGDTDRTVKQTGGLNKRNDIDRQLKNIMKDYGPNDIYSPPRALNMKIGLIGAAVLAGALLSGYYFFSSSNPSSASPTRTQSLQSATPGPESSAGGSAAARGPSKGNGLEAVSKNPGKTN